MSNKNFLKFLLFISITLLALSEAHEHIDYSASSISDMKTPFFKSKSEKFYWVKTNINYNIIDFFRFS